MKKYKSKFLLVVGAILMLMSMTGCKNPTDAEGNVKLITTASTFGEVFKEDNWFQGLFVYPMSQAMNYLAPIIGAVGAIAVVTALVQLIVFLLTRKSTIASQRMQLIQPEMQKIQKKYEGKKDEVSQMKMAQEMQALYKKYDINPLSSFSMLLQLPIIFAIFLAVQRCDAIVHGSFLGLSLEQSPWNGMKEGQWLYIVLFGVMIVAQMASMMLPQWLAKQKAMKAGKKAPDKNPMMSSMYMSMGLILLISIMWPTAMVVYWIVSSLVNIIKTLSIQMLYLDKDPVGKKGK